MSLKVRRLDAGARLPSRAYPDDAGLDLYALEEAVLEPGQRASVGTGIAVEIPDDQAGRVDERDPVPGREPRARQHEAGVPVGDLDRNPGADRCAFPGRDRRLLERVQIESGVAGIGARREQRAIVEPPDA